MVMMMFKACPRCGGDVHMTSDMYGRYAECIQCGHTRDIPEKRLVEARLARAVAAEKQAA